jgi:hypothetical protein
VLDLDAHILGQKAGNHTHINVRLFRPASRNSRRSMLLKVIIKRGNEVLGRGGGGRRCELPSMLGGRRLELIVTLRSFGQEWRCLLGQ